MNDRRRFLHVLGATTAAAALPACGGSDTTTGTSATGAGGAGGAGGGGAGGSATSSTAASSTASATSSTGTGSECPPVGNLVGVPGDFVKSGLHIVQGTKVLIGRDAQGLYALTSICPHEFCDMDEKKGGVSTGTITAAGISCGCHGSKFDLLGAVLKGPATKALKAYAMTLCDGKIYVDKTTVVAITERLNA